MIPTTKAPRTYQIAVEDLTDIEDFEDADCDRLDDLMVHFEGNGWQADGDERVG